MQHGAWIYLLKYVYNKWYDLKRNKNINFNRDSNEIALRDFIF